MAKTPKIYFFHKGIPPAHRQKTLELCFDLRNSRSLDIPIGAYETTSNQYDHPIPQQHRQQIKWLTRHLLVDALNKMKICSIKKRKLETTQPTTIPTRTPLTIWATIELEAKRNSFLRLLLFRHSLTPSNSYPIHYTLFH